MIIAAVALILFVVLVGVTLLGGRLRRLLPEEQLSAESKDAIKLALGLVGTMTAILLGLQGRLRHYPNRSDPDGRESRLA